VSTGTLFTKIGNVGLRTT